jgi:hypothetical protein
MKYILDSSGYVESASCNPISCDDKVSQEYTGSIPSGYDSLDDWILNANIRAYKITNGNLVYDAARDEALQAEWALEGKEVVLFESENGVGGNITLKDDYTNYSELEITAKSNGSVWQTFKVPTTQTKFRICIVDNNGSGSNAWLKTAFYELSGKTITCTDYFWKNINGNNYGAENTITIYKITGYR